MLDFTDTADTADVADTTTCFPLPVYCSLTCTVRLPDEQYLIVQNLFLKIGNAYAFLNTCSDS